MTKSRIHDYWARLSVPTNAGELSATHVRGTNAWVVKDHSNGFGLILTGVREPARRPPYRNLRFSFRQSKFLEEAGRSREVRDCLVVTLDPSCSGEALATVIERMGLKHPDGAYATEALIQVIDDAAELFTLPRPAPSKEAVVGAWGELYLVEQILSRAGSDEDKERVLRAWEAEGPLRDIVDFRFSNSKILIEVKTTVGERVHHIGGFGQVTVPSEWSKGYLASVTTKEVPAGSGRTTADLSTAIRSAAPSVGVESVRFVELVNAKLLRRGPETLDTRYRFSAGDDAISLYPFERVPRPSSGAGVLEVEWTVDLQDTLPLSRDEAQGVLTAASNGQSSGSPNA